MLKISSFDANGNHEWIIGYMRTCRAGRSTHRLLLPALGPFRHLVQQSSDKDPIQEFYNARLGGPTHVRKGARAAAKL